MNVLFALLVLFPVMPPPWVPPQPLAPPLVVEYAGDGTLTTIVRDDGAIASFTPHTSRDCFVITARDADGQEYHYQARSGCGFTIYVPLRKHHEPKHTGRERGPDRPL